MQKIKPSKGNQFPLKFFIFISPVFHPFYTRIFIKNIGTLSTQIAPSTSQLEVL
ncbi:hypothetical protein AsAng_0060480 [Aureispira anguillae]|uniref:Uncharacterized protein n=1 Tax=Aureispira anguillae TaxID=2864201 RepID=A0A916DVL5_9BACT|nr:hypothetical protein AsAng_0060480 [Aureispira anguillae]